MKSTSINLELRIPNKADFPKYLAGLKALAEVDPDPIRHWKKVQEDFDKDPDQFMERKNSEVGGWEFTAKNGETLKALPNRTRWSFLGEKMVGEINLRWDPKKNELPDYVSGHIGYLIFPEFRKQGYATEQLRLMLPEAKAVNLKYVEITTDFANIASQKVILNNGGVFISDFEKLPTNGVGMGKLFKIELG
jgi:predicted acetyltransferase